MRFISNGDFVFPFDSHVYWVKQIYVWSYQTGATNPDGFIRMPGRLLDVLVFALFGNLAASYFYLISSLVFTFVCFYYFSCKFLAVSSWRVCAIGALFFTFNPIFLGNVSKVGLVLATAMLPASLAVLHETFSRRKFRYLLLWVLFLNISLIHPFTFTINLLVSGTYFIFQVWRNRKFVLQHFAKFALVGFTALLLNAYLILPLLSIGSVNKSVLSSDITSAPVDYSTLVEISNTGDIFTGLSLSKNVLKDYDFYSPSYATVYFLGAFVFYVILLGAYLRVEKKLSISDKRRFSLLLAAFLLLILLATVKFLHVDTLLRAIINLPGGWIFRAPLKWQLYIPFCLFAMLTIVLSHTRRSKRRILLFALLGVVFVLMNAFIGFDIYNKLLTPRTVTHFNYLQNLDLDHKNMLVVGSDLCFTYAENNPAVMTELNQILTSKNVQVKQLDVGDVDTVNLNSYDYIFSCQGVIQPILSTGYSFTLTHTFAKNAFELYANKRTQPYIRTDATLIALSQVKQLANKYNFIHNELHKPFEFADASSVHSQPAQGVQDIFDSLSPTNFRNDTITVPLNPIRTGDQKLYVRGQNHKLYYTASENHNNVIAISTSPIKNYRMLPPTSNAQAIPIAAQSSKQLTFNYIDPSYNYKNLIKNPSFEYGLWQKKVGDCYAYDNEPSISMQLVNDATNGKHAVQLQAKNHIACTGISHIAVRPGQHYLLSFDYKSIGGRYAGYYIGFNGASYNYISGHLPVTDGMWKNFSDDILIPPKVYSIQLLIYAYPEGDGITPGIARYDNFFLTATPDIQSNFYLVSKPKNFIPPQNVDYTWISPTITNIHVHGVRTAFFLETSESYSPHWQLEPTQSHSISWLPASASSAIPEQNHIDINGFSNGWFVDPAQVCATKANCTKNADGSMDINLTMEFMPQRYLSLGILVSSVTVVMAIVYFVFDARRDHSQRRYWRWRN